MSEHGDERTGEADQANGGRALVVLAAASQGPQPAAQRADAAFLTQMIASRASMGPFRRFRRAEPEVALRSYRDRAAACTTPAPRRAGHSA